MLWELLGDARQDCNSSDPVRTGTHVQPKPAEVLYGGILEQGRKERWDDVVKTKELS